MQKFIAGLIVGAAAGAAMALFLQSEKGKEIVEDIKDAAGDTGEKLKTRMQHFEQEVKDLLKKGKQFMDDLENKAKDAATGS